MLNDTLCYHERVEYDMAIFTPEMKRGLSEVDARFPRYRWDPEGSVGMTKKRNPDATTVSEEGSGSDDRLNTVDDVDRRQCEFAGALAETLEGSYEKFVVTMNHGCSNIVDTCEKLC